MRLMCSDFRERRMISRTVANAAASNAPAAIHVMRLDPALSAGVATAVCASEFARGVEELSAGIVLESVRASLSEMEAGPDVAFGRSDLAATGGAWVVGVELIGFVVAAITRGSVGAFVAMTFAAESKLFVTMSAFGFVAGFSDGCSAGVVFVALIEEVAVASMALAFVLAAAGAAGFASGSGLFPKMISGLP